MSLKISKKLVRLILIALIAQFFSPAFTAVSREEKPAPDHYSLASKAEKPFGFYLFITGNNVEEKEKEGKGNEVKFSSPLIDFDCVTQLLTQSHSPATNHLVQQRPTSMPLFKLHSVFII